MALVSKPFTFSAGAVIVASEHNSNFDTLYNLVNGAIDNANISPSAAIVDTKLAQITTISKVASSAIDGWKTGDWTISSVTTARTGWTNVSATHTGRFMRINATPLSTGGADTHTHTAGSYAAASHTHNVSVGFESNDTGGNFAGQSGATGSAAPAVTGSSATANNIPAFVQTVVFQRD